MLSCILPGYHAPLIHKTTQSILDNAVGKAEVINVYDGYWDTPIDDPRVKALHLGENRGMRGAINAGVAIAKGGVFNHIPFRLFFWHCWVHELLPTTEDNQIVT